MSLRECCWCCCWRWRGSIMPFCMARKRGSGPPYSNICWAVGAWPMDWCGLRWWCWCCCCCCCMMCCWWWCCCWDDGKGWWNGPWCPKAACTLTWDGPVRLVWLSSSIRSASPFDDSFQGSKPTKEKKKPRITNRVKNCLNFEYFDFWIKNKNVFLCPILKFHVDSSHKHFTYLYLKILVSMLRRKNNSMALTTYFESPNILF